jgi:HK97 family phage prohead protease
MRRELRDIECRFDPGESGAIAGYAAVWGKPDSFGDVLVRGAFADSLAQHRAAGTRVAMLRSHDPSRPIGTWDSIVEDARGLKVSGSLIMDSIDGRDAFALMKGGALDGLSIGFRTVRAATLPKGGRRVEAVNLIEISAVTLPSQDAARLTSVRSDHLAAGTAAFIRECAAKLQRTTR